MLKKELPCALLACLHFCGLLIGQPLNAQTPDQANLEYGIDALAVCESEATVYQIVCKSWIRGFLDGAEGAKEIEYWIPQYCADHGINVELARTIFVAYLNAHTDMLMHASPYIFRLALREHYPCQRAAIGN